MKNFIRILHGTMRTALLLALVGLALQSAHAQTTCELWTVDSANDVYENGCINIEATDITVTDEVSTDNYNYVVDVAAGLQLFDTSSYLTYAGPICTENGGYPGFSNPCEGGDTGDDVFTGVDVPNDPTQVYTLEAYYGECYDSSGEGGYGPPEFGGSCGWNYPGNTETLTTSQFNPAYQISTLLYSPPGNQSKSGFGTSTTNGTTSTVAQSFTKSDGITFSGGVANLFSGGGSYTYSSTSNISNAFTEQFTNATNITTDDNSNSAYNSLGLNGTTLSDAINHHLDTFELLLNPQATVVSDGDNNVIGYSVGLQPLDGGAGQIDMPGVVAESMENNSLYPSQLNPQVISTPTGNATIPGMAAMCSNVNQSEYQAGSCTQSDQCGCQKSDYNTILSADLLLGWNSSTETASPYSGTESPLDADAAGASTCLNSPGSNTDCRYVIVPSSSGSTVPLYEPLSGDQGVTYSVTDQTTDTRTIGTQHQYSVGITYSLGLIVTGLSASNTWTWNDSSSTGTINGYNNSQSVSLQTGTASCNENVSFYEDTVYHTFAFQVPTGSFGCN